MTYAIVFLLGCVVGVFAVLGAIIYAVAAPLTHQPRPGTPRKP